MEMQKSIWRCRKCSAVSRGILCGLPTCRPSFSLVAEEGIIICTITSIIWNLFGDAYLSSCEAGFAMLRRLIVGLWRAMLEDVRSALAAADKLIGIHQICA